MNAKFFGALMVAMLLCASPAQADDRYAVTGMVVYVDAERGTFAASIDAIPGFMAAMTMPFQARDRKDFLLLSPGASVSFTLVVGTASSYVEGIRVLRYESVEQDPARARRLALFREIATGRAAKALPVGARVPDFTLTDSRERPVTFSALRGKVVVVNFMYTTCQLSDYCLRIVNHFGALQKRFAAELGRELLFLTITFDPERDTPEVLAKYASQWTPDFDVWSFLTGPVSDVQRVLDLFGVAAFPAEGLMDHALHTVLIDREGRVVTNIEGNQFTTDQLGDLTAAVLNRR